MEYPRFKPLAQMAIRSTLGFALLAGPSLAAARQVDRCSIFRDASLVDVARGAIDAHRDVIVRAGTIASIDPTSNRSSPCQSIDARGRFLMPGLIDSHVHLFGYSRIGDGDPATQRAVLDLLLAHGVTSALIMEGTPSELRLRQSVAARQLIGPRLFIAGPLLQAPDTGGLPGRPTFETPADVQREVRTEKRLGYDFVKVHGAMPAATYSALLGQARASGLRVIGHVPDNLGLRAALDGGQVMIAHAESYLQTFFEFNRDLPRDPAQIARMAAAAARWTRSAGTEVQPTLSVFRQISNQVEAPAKLLGRAELLAIPQPSLCDWYPPNNPYLNHWTGKDLPRFAAQYRVMEALVRALDRAGVPLLVGTDDMVPMQLPGASMIDEMEALRGAGLSSAAVLRAATLSPARFLHPSEKNGDVKVGYRADILMLEGNPLADLRNAGRIAGVMIDGQWLSPSWLKARVEADIARNRGARGGPARSITSARCVVQPPG